MHPAEVVHAVLGGLQKQSVRFCRSEPSGLSWRNGSDLVILPALDAAQRRHPLLHLLPVVCTEDEASARRDYLQTGTPTVAMETRTESGDVSLVDDISEPKTLDLSGWWGCGGDGTLALFLHP